jgi:acetoin utilization deacetylase AcuC-like enzyme
MPEKPGPPQALIVDDRRFDQHVAAVEHPERPARLDAARRAIETSRIRTTAVAARLATDEELARVHDRGFLDEMARLRGHSCYLDPDTYVCPASIDVARLAAGASVAIVDAIIDTGVTKGVALVRPPGHHAGRTRAMGFCLFNNVAVAAAQARARGMQRVAVVDWDVHHGNGTQEIFLCDPHVLYISVHQSPLYPGTGFTDEVGEEDGTGYTVNVPLAAGAGDATYAAAFERVILPILEAYAPELVLVSAGFDASARDPLAQMQLSAEAFGFMAKKLSTVAATSAEGRMILFLEGGYDLQAIEAGLRCAARGAVLAQASLVAPAIDESVDSAAAAAKKFWPAIE